MANICRSLTDDQCLSVARIFTHSLNLVNIAENHHRFRLIKAEEKSQGLEREDCLEGTLRVRAAARVAKALS